MLEKLSILPVLCIFVFGYFSVKCAFCEDGTKFINIQMNQRLNGIKSK